MNFVEEVRSSTNEAKTVFYGTLPLVAYQLYVFVMGGFKMNDLIKFVLAVLFAGYNWKLTNCASKPKACHTIAWINAVSVLLVVAQKIGVFNKLKL